MSAKVFADTNVLLYLLSDDAVKKTRAKHVLSAQPVISLQARYKLQYYDSLIIATALENDCDILYSEDM